MTDWEYAAYTAIKVIIIALGLWITIAVNL
jgi:hypothetical protein